MQSYFVEKERIFQVSSPSDKNAAPGDTPGAVVCRMMLLRIQMPYASVIMVRLANAQAWPRVT